MVFIYKYGTYVRIYSSVYYLVCFLYSFYLFAIFH
jgi:hypothetical protein